MPEIAKSATLRHGDGFYLDGRMFPWLVLVTPSPTVTVDEGLTLITVTIPVEGDVEVIAK